MKFTFPGPIYHDLSGFEICTELYESAKDCFHDDIEIDMRNSTWFDADMCGIVGALLYRMGDDLNTVRLTNIDAVVRKILSKNGFLSHYGEERISDRWGTTIAYQRFDVQDDRYFSDYIEREFISRAEMPNMSPGLLKKFRESIFEIFSNAVLHSRSDLGIFNCGQYFPNRERLNLTVADLGVGIRKNVIDHLRTDIPAEEAIEWATQGRNTTKRGDVPGGLGLKLLREFIDLNGGCMQIVSDSGYWCRRNDDTTKVKLPHGYPGTVVSVEINTADTHSYALHSEVSLDDIF